MSDQTSQSTGKGSAGRATTLFLVGVIGVAVVGYCVGITDGVPEAGLETASQNDTLKPDAQVEGGAGQVIPATTYAMMRRTDDRIAAGKPTSIKTIPQPEYDLFAEIKPSEADKARSTETRASRRHFNGAPPIIPHAVEKTSDAACYACHGNGLKIGDRVAGKMSHGFLANCLQCHAPPTPQIFASFDLEVQTDFVGLAAPMKGDRAFPGAPPTIPHSTWMRQDCLSCHGGTTVWSGFQSTHPWRVACKQCHAPSASLNQSPMLEVGFVPGPSVATSPSQDTSE